MHLLRVDAFSLPALPCACATLRRATRALTQSYESAFRGTGLEISQFTVLQTLHGAGELTQRKLGEILVLDTTTLSRSLAPLERQGWIAVQPGQDRREKRISITPAGKARMTAALQPWNRVQSKLRKTLSENGWTETMNSLEKLTAAALVLEQSLTPKGHKR